MIGILIVMNNYLHDLASATLLVSGIVLFVFAKRAERQNGAETLRFFLDSCRALNKLLTISLVWIVLGGAVRAWAYMDYEWAPLAGRGLLAALAVKHVVLFGAVFGGAVYWKKVRARERALRARVEKPAL